VGVGLSRASDWARVVKNCPMSTRSLCESTRLNTEKCWVGLGEVVESAIMVVTLDQRWLVLSTGWVGFGQAFGRSNAVESCPSLPSWSSRTR